MPLQNHEIPTVVIVDDLDDRTTSISQSVIYNNTDGGEEEVFTDISYYDIDKSSLIDDIIEVVYDNFDYSVDKTDLEFITDNLKEYDINTLLAVFILLKNDHWQNVELEYFLNGYIIDDLNDTHLALRINLGVIPYDRDVEVEVQISGVTYYEYLSDIFCCNESYEFNLPVEIEQDSGRIVRIPSDIYTCTSGIPYFDTSIYNATMTSGIINTELTTASGSIDEIHNDIYATCLVDLVPHPVEIKTRSLFTGDFFLEVDRYTTASSTAWVDIIDYLYPINIDNTNFYVDEVPASGVYFTDIPNGKRMYYNPIDDFYDVGVKVYTLHSENSIGEVEEKDFYLLYGYDLQLSEVVDWGPKNKVVVRAEAKNLVFCSNTEAHAFDFTTTDLTSFNLNCMITPVGYVDLGVSIYPQSTTFFYGKTYTVKLRNVKDYAGNIMPDLEYTFTIEDPLT
jgi:hypothetical protein